MPLGVDRLLFPRPPGGVGEAASFPFSLLGGCIAEKLLVCTHGANVALYGTMDNCTSYITARVGGAPQITL